MFTFNKIHLSIVSSLTISILFYFFASYSWGGGIVTIVISFCLTIFSIFGTLIISAIISKKKTNQHVLITSVFTFLLWVTVFIASESDKPNNNYLVDSFFSDGIKENIEIINSKSYQVDLGFELYIEAKSTPVATRRFLAYNDYERMKSPEYDIPDLNCPRWFPDNFDDKMDYYEVNHFEKGYFIAIISDDETKIFALKLDY